MLVVSHYSTKTCLRHKTQRPGVDDCHDDDDDYHDDDGGWDGMGRDGDGDGDDEEQGMVWLHT